MPTAGARRLALVGPFLVVVAALVAYWPALTGGWIWDDPSYVTRNPHLRSAQGLLSIWTLSYDPATGWYVPNTPQYYPLVFTGYWIEHALFGLRPAVFHATNLALHLANAWLVWKLARELRIPAAGLVAALFALHPLNVESVAWVTERKNVLSGLFFLGSFLAFLRYDERRERGAYVLSLVLFACALLSKSVTATLPVLLLLALFWRHRRLAWSDVRLILPFLALGAFSGWATAAFERFKVGAEGQHYAETAGERWLFVAPRAWWHYAWKTLWPFEVAFIYPRWDARRPVPFDWSFPVATVLLAGGLWIARRRIGPGPLQLVLASAITLAPALGFVPVLPHRFSWVADHFAYLGTIPLIALYVVGLAAIVEPLTRHAPKAGTAHMIGALVLALFTWRSHVAARSYENEQRLWTDTLAKTPDAWIALINLGILRLGDDPLTPERAAAGLELFQRAERIPLGRTAALLNQGHLYLRLRRPDEAIDRFRRARAAGKGQAGERASLGSDHIEYERAGFALCEAHVQRVRALIAARRHREAVSASEEGLRDVDACEPLQQLCAWIQSTSADASARDGRQARATAELLVARRPGDFGLLDILAAACAESGDFDAAVRHAEAALAGARKAGNPAAPTIARRLESYRAHRPWRE